MEDGGRRGGESDARGEEFDLLIFKMEQWSHEPKNAAASGKANAYSPLEPLERNVS